MNHFQPATADMAFVLQSVLQAPQQLQALPAHAEADTDLMQQVLEESGKFVAEVVAPLNRDGDEIGAQFRDGAVTMPPMETSPLVPASFTIAVVAVAKPASTCAKSASGWPER